MPGELWKRPSAVVVATAIAVVGFFAARGRLAVSETPAQATAKTGRSGSSKPGAQPAPTTVNPPTTVVKANAGGRSIAQPRALVRGRVYDRAGFRIVGADVVPAGEGMPKAHTGADGEFAIDLPVPSPALLVSAPGCQPQWWLPRDGDPGPMCVQLAPAAPWDRPGPPPARVAGGLFGAGQVLGVEGRPLAGALVTAVGGAAWARTDELGRFTVALPGREARLLVHAPEAAADGCGLAVLGEPLVLPRDQGVFPVADLRAEPASALRGTLRDSGGNPVAGAVVKVTGAGWQRTVETGMSGWFRLGGLLPGRYEVQPLGHRGEFGRRREVLVDAPHVDCELQLVPAIEQRVQVVDERGGHCAGVHVAAMFDGERCGVATADGEGWAALRLVAGGAEFEVRDGEAQVWAVRRYDADSARLVVAAP